MGVFGQVSDDKKNVKLSDGSLHPIIGFGTYKVGFVPASSNTAGQPGHAPDQDPKDIIKDAVSSGYRYIDCAQFYGNEEMVGQALKECGVPREELYLVSKVWGDKIYDGKEAILSQLDKTLKDLQTDYLDMYLIHWPVPGKHVAGYQVLEEVMETKKVRAIGVSNYTIEDYEELKKSMKVKPLVNQIEVNPFLFRKKTLDYFAKEGVVTQSYRALRQGKGFDNEIIQKLAAKYSKTPAQIMGRWCTQQGIVLVAKSAKKERMVENMGVFDFSLSDEDFKELEGLTTPENLEEYKALYFKCIIRDTPLDKASAEEKEAIFKRLITLD